MILCAFDFMDIHYLPRQFTLLSDVIDSRRANHAQQQSEDGELGQMILQTLFIRMSLTSYQPTYPIITARRVPVYFSGAKSNVVSISMGREEES